MWTASDSNTMGCDLCDFCLCNPRAATALAADTEGAPFQAPCDAWEAARLAHTNLAWGGGAGASASSGGTSGQHTQSQEDTEVRAT